MEPHVYERMRELEQVHWWFVARRRILGAEIARLPLPANPRILEAGCGTGGNLELLKRFGQVQAIEPDAESRAYAAQRAGVPVDRGFLPDDLPAFDQPFDLIAALDVIEHVDDDVGAVAALGLRLAPGGFMITTVPAYQWLWSEHDAQHHHKRRYTLPAYRRLFDAAGLKVRRATYFNSLLLPPIAAVRVARSLARVGGADDERLPSPPVNRALDAIFGSEAALLRAIDLPAGVSILLIAERPR